MGSVHFGVPEALILFLKHRFDLEDFVETGTFQGNSAVWASQHFKRVFTIEASEPLWQAARTRHAQFNNLHFMLGDSSEQLKGLLSSLSRPLFWLDAHWCGSITAGESRECPLLAELAAISAAQLEQYVIGIDDARFFLGPPPTGHKWNQWPDLSAVVSALKNCGGPYIAVKDDVIVAVPLAARGDLVDFLRRHESGPKPDQLHTKPSAPVVPPIPLHIQRRIALMRQRGISLVLDVGANTGQYGTWLRKSGFRGRIVSFEPLSDAFALLQRTASKDPLWECHNIGISDVEGTAIINISANSYSSSFLPIGTRSVQIEPGIAYVGRQEARLRRLDDMIEGIARSNEAIYLKIDTQGYELKVLKGALKTIKRVQLIQLETAFSEGYQGQPLIEDVIRFLRKLKYRIVSIEPGWEDFKTAEMLEADMILARAGVETEVTLRVNGSTATSAAPISVEVRVRR
jgi:FkbM family methyltransferase